MTSDELRQRFATGYRIIARERAMRNRVFPEGHPQRTQKLQEIDELLMIYIELKNELKERLLAEEYRQEKLLDVHPRGGYPGSRPRRKGED